MATKSYGDKPRRPKTRGTSSKNKKKPSLDKIMTKAGYGSKNPTGKKVKRSGRKKT